MPETCWRSFGRARSEARRYSLAPSFIILPMLSSCRCSARLSRPEGEGEKQTDAAVEDHMSAYLATSAPFLLEADDIFSYLRNIDRGQAGDVRTRTSLREAWQLRSFVVERLCRSVSP